MNNDHFIHQWFMLVITSFIHNVFSYCAYPNAYLNKMGGKYASNILNILQISQLTCK